MSSLYTQIDMLRQERDEARALVRDLVRLFDADLGGLATTLKKISKHASGFTWIVDGRGSYEWTDDRYREEAGNALRPIIEMADKAYSRQGEAIAALAKAETAVRAWGSQ